MSIPDPGTPLRPPIADVVRAWLLKDDRPQLVGTTGGSELRIDEFHRWAAPLADQITAALVANLAQRLDGAQVWAFGQR
jgi:uncharacterized lipoprotein YmbA